MNTAGRDGEQLPDPAALDEFTRAWEWTGERTHDQAELQAVCDLRPRLRQLWEADEEQTVAIVNSLLRDANALPRLVRHGSWGYHLHATRPGAPLATRMAVEAAMAFLDLVRAGELDRLRICAYPAAATSWSTSARTSPSATATPAAATEPPSTHTAPACGRTPHPPGADLALWRLMLASLTPPRVTVRKHPAGLAGANEWLPPHAAPTLRVTAIRPLTSVKFFGGQFLALG